MSRTNRLKNPVLRKTIWENCKGKCVSCSCGMLFESYGSNPPWECDNPNKYVNGLNSIVFSIDHIKPHSKGGRTKLKNAQLLCPKHNLEIRQEMINQIRSRK